MSEEEQITEGLGDKMDLLLRQGRCKNMNKGTKIRNVWEGLPWWSSGWDSMLPMQGAWVQSLVGELDPACMPQLRIPHAATKDPSCRSEDPTCHS